MIGVFHSVVVNRRQPNLRYTPYIICRTRAVPYITLVLLCHIPHGIDTFQRIKKDFSYSVKRSATEVRSPKTRLDSRLAIRVVQERQLPRGFLSLKSTLWGQALPVPGFFSFSAKKGCSHQILYASLRRRHTPPATLAQGGKISILWEAQGP